MATGTANFAYHSTIAAANTAETVTLVTGTANVEVYNRSTVSGQDLFLNVGSGSTVATNSNDVYIIPAGTSDNIRSNFLRDGDAIVVKVISSTIGLPYSVIAR